MMQSLLIFACAAIALAIENPFPFLKGYDMNRRIVHMKKSKSLNHGTFSLNHLFNRLNISTIMNLDSINGVVVSVGEELVEHIRNHDSVSLVERDPPRWLMGRDGLPFKPPAKRSNPSSKSGPQRTPWGITASRSLEVPAVGGTKICIIDSGYDIRHEDLFTSPDFVTG